MTINEAICLCRDSGLKDWEMVEFAVSLVNKNMAYSYTNSFDMPAKAFKRKKGYCWQQAKALKIILQSLGITCWMVYAAQNIIPQKEYEGVTVKEHISGHIWCRVYINGVEKDVCPGNSKNEPNKLYFTPITKVRRWSAFMSFLSYFSSAFVNYKRYKKIKRKKANE